MAPKVTSTIVDEKPEQYEGSHVHDVYELIASHFSSTRYKPWPVIASYLSTIPTGWIGLDSGTGNGKYLPLPLDRPNCIHTIGMDRSLHLLEIAKNAGGSPREVVRGDVLGRGWRNGVFDYAISIATIHHLATNERRMQSVQRLLEAVAPDHGRILIYVWATEQDEASKRVIPIENQSSETGQDVLVPWVLASAPGPDQEKDADTVLHRYYHMFSQGELTTLVHGAARMMGLEVGPRCDGRDMGVEILQDDWERSNYFVELRRWKND
ncbi:S-adenosyl-L-methionine-dependent methyltransferase [Mucidula mucida]|nr:S-adenosyl-L-methionine-dependent methyltransferase [Mucidula mucida]